MLKTASICSKSRFFALKLTTKVARMEKYAYLCRAKAQMAESVDALVSNTSGAIHPGSIPGLGTVSG